MNTLLLVNPTAGHGRAGRLAGQALRAARAAWGEVEQADTSGPGDAVVLAREAAEQGVERILVLGGDGTLHEAANGLLRARVDARPPIAILPAGTGNDYAKIAGTYRCSPDRAVERLRGGRVRRFDVGRAWGEYFINSVGIGFDAEVAREINESKRGTGLPAYLMAVFKVLSGFSPYEVSIVGDAQRFSDRLLLLEIGIGPVVGGGFRLTPFAKPDDGLFDICAIQHTSIPAVLVKLPLVMLGRHTRLRQVRYFQTTRLSVESPNGPLHAQFDGELREVSGRMDLCIEPGLLPVLVGSA